MKLDSQIMTGEENVPVDVTRLERGTVHFPIDPVVHPLFVRLFAILL
ncbi:hypothetical protein [Amycolatopsis lexingtonensis]